jgi:hypothetical protein
MENNLRFNVSKCKVLTITRKKNPIIHDYTLGSQNLTRVDSEKDLGITTTSKLSWDIHANTIVAKANKILGVLRRTCTKLMDMKARRTLYLSLVKSQLCYATEVWSPVNSVQISRRVEKVQRRATRWITMTKRGELSYRERLLALDLLPLTYDREVRDLVYFFKSLFNYIDINIDNYVSFVSHGRTRLSHTSRYILQSKLCKTNTFQSSYYNRVVKIWNTVCQEVSPDIFHNPNSFKHYLKRRYYTLISNVYDVDMACTWSLTRDCPCHRT